MEAVARARRSLGLVTSRLKPPLLIVATGVVDADAAKAVVGSQAGEDLAAVVFAHRLVVAVKVARTSFGALVLVAHGAQVATVIVKAGKLGVDASRVGAAFAGLAVVVPLAAHRDPDATVGAASCPGLALAVACAADFPREGAAFVGEADVARGAVGVVPALGAGQGEAGKSDDGDAKQMNHERHVIPTPRLSGHKSPDALG